MTTTPIYDAALEEATDVAVDHGDDAALERLAAMDADTRGDR